MRTPIRMLVGTANILVAMAALLWCITLSVSAAGTDRAGSVLPEVGAYLALTGIGLALSQIAGRPRRLWAGDGRLILASPSFLGIASIVLTSL